MVKKMFKTGVALVAIAAPGLAAAGTSTEFDSVHTQFREWVQGTGGMAIAVGAIGLGGLASLAKQTPFPILTGIGSAILLQYSPDVTDAIFTAVV